ncbi:type II toxin-antitoxin system prevent-host-death family antitoxin [Microbacterium paraoxydans]|uniref:type II toxin-antitoxin system prevent-host-death family antitoxin n=1 Tax=Microbacterium paraoxydans TaxID=199592 RepID=UPI0035A8957C
MEARNNLSRLIAASQAGEDVVITKRGTPVARLVPIGSVVTLRSGRLLVEWADSGLKTPDALHLAAAQLSGCTEPWTNDERLAAASPGLAVDILDRGGAAGR